MEGEKEGEKHQCVAASHMLPTGDLARNPGMCPDWESNQQPFGSQASVQSTEPHQPGLFFNVLLTPIGWIARHGVSGISEILLTKCPTLLQHLCKSSPAQNNIPNIKTQLNKSLQVIFCT